MLPREHETKLTVHIHQGLAYFEIIDRMTTVVSGASETLKERD